MLGLVGAFMLGCGALSKWWLRDGVEAWGALLGCGAGVGAVAAALWWGVRSKAELTRKDGVGVVTFGWVAACLAGAVPFWASGTIGSWSGAVFESVSGFTTTGASVIADVEGVARGLLLWRAVSQFLGGVGVLVLLVAILPMAGAGGSQLFRAELPGPTKDRVEPRIANNAKILWGVYLLLTGALVVVLLPKMDFFEALCHALCTLSTGGFSTRNASVAAFGSGYVEWVVTAFMLLGAMNFTLHWRTLRGGGLPHWRDGETRFYLAAVAVVTAAAAWSLRRNGLGVGDAVRTAAFTVATLSSSTGFGVADYNAWPAAIKAALLGLMLMGGVSGSTAGGAKVGRVQVVAKTMTRELRKFMQPKAVLPMKHGGRTLDEGLLLSILGFVSLFAALLAAGTVALIPMMPDAVSALGAAAASLGNTGPGFGAVGPAETYAGVPAPGLWVLSGLMLAGRLELYTALAVFAPSFWRR